MQEITVRKIQEPQFSGNFEIIDLGQLLVDQNMEEGLHRHDFFFLLVLEAASGKHHIDFQACSVVPNSITLIRPGQVHELLVEQGSKGYLITFDHGYYTSNFSTQNDVFWKALHLRPEYYVGMAFLTLILFPIVLISMLESASVAGIYSKPVWSSFGKVPGTWFKFFSLSTLCFAGGLGSLLAIVHFGMLEPTPLHNTAVVAGVFGLVFCLTLYFRLMGRLAFVMSEKILVEDEPDPDEGGTHEQTEDDAEISLV